MGISCVGNVSNDFDPELITNFSESLFAKSKAQWFLKTSRRFFFLSDPREEMYEREEEVPDLFAEGVPAAVVFIVIETILLHLTKKPVASLMDNGASGSFMFMWHGVRLLTRGVEHSLYSYIYNNYRLLDLPWDSVHVWYISAILIDFGAYWVHRLGHDINLLWAHHQIHHTAEFFSMVTVLRMPPLVDLTTSFVYLPLSFLVPPTHYLLHVQFCLIWNFWIHTELVGDLGWIEWILNTPRAHKVHHGCNRVCIDKNYASVFIIWDRLLGTYQPFPKDLDITYGLVDQPQSLNPYYLWFNGYRGVYRKFKSMNGWKNKLYSLIKGPGWMPGTSWHGDVTQVPEVVKREKYAPVTRWYWTAYHFVHFTFIIASYELVALLRPYIGELAVTCHVAFIFVSAATEGLFIDGNANHCFFEWLRCSLVAMIICKGTPTYSLALSLLGFPDVWIEYCMRGIQYLFSLSALLWGFISVKELHERSLRKSNGIKSD